MPHKSAGPLRSAELIAFAPTVDPARARAFYQDVLGLKFVSDDAFAVVFDAHGTALRVVNVSSIEGFEPAPYTIVGWGVADIESTVDELSSKGVGFQRYPGMKQDKRGIWTSPSGARIAWFNDPDGNVLSVTEY